MSSLLRPPLWAPPLAPGRLRAYDDALKYIRADSRNLKLEITQLKAAHLARAAAQAKAGASHDPDALHAYRQKLHILEVQSEVNLPEVRAAFKTGKFPYTKPVYRHLTEQKWRKDGTLDRLMERLHQMHVIPDVLPALHPTVDLRIHFPRAAPATRTVHDRARRFDSIEPGVFLTSDQTRAPPRVSATAFHPDTRLYTMLLLDPDVPDQSTSSYQTFLHWLQPNIPLSNTRRISLIPATSPALPYIPPHPQHGTPYHRYVLLLLPQPSPAPLDISVPGADSAPTAAPRTPFDVRAFVQRWGFQQGGGAHMWRAVWDAGVSDIYRDVLNAPEPRYGRLPKHDPYAELKDGNRRRY